jgi:predicted esterase
MNERDPHAGAAVATAGPDPGAATAGAVLLHGRGARAESVLQLTADIDVEGVAYLAPQAADDTWYPRSFLAPVEANQPFLDSALATVERACERLVEAGVSAERTLVGGFSQGACLATEYVARNPRRYGGVAALSGGLVGPEGTAFDYEGSVDGTPVFLGCSDRDPHIPVERVHETAAVFEELDGEVDERIYEGMGHTINADELTALRNLVADL